MGGTCSKVSATADAIREVAQDIKKQTDVLEDKQFRTILSTIQSVGSDLKAQTEALKDGQVANLLDSLSGTLHFAQSLAQWATLAGGLIAVTKTLYGIEAERHIKKLTGEISASLKDMAAATQVTTNLHHQTLFHVHVWNFVSHESQVALSCPGTENKIMPHYFFVYHPASDWHPALAELLKTRPLPGFIGAMSNLDALGVFLLEFRTAVGPDPILHVLLPSAHMYVLPEEINVPPALLPLRITGQSHYSNSPYCHATVIGMDRSWLRDVGILPPRPHKEDISVSGRIAATSAACGAGVGAAVATYFGGCATGGAAFGLLSLACPPLLAVETVAIGSVLGASAIASVATATFAARSAEKRVKVSYYKHDNKDCL